MSKLPDKAQRIVPLIIKRGDDGALSLSASLSSERPVRQVFGVEILRHDEDSINMERAARGLPLLFNHNPDTLIGRATGIHLENRRLVADRIEFSDNPDAQRIKADIDAGFLTDMSLRYSIDDATRSETDDGEQRIEVTRFTPLEASVVTVPADPDVGIGRSETEGKTVSDDNTTPKDDGQVNVVEFEAARNRALAEGQTRGQVIERERIAAIDTLFQAARFQGGAYDALRAECIDKGSTIEQTRAALLDLFGKEPDSVSQPPPDAPTPDPFGTTIAGDDERDKFIQGAERAILVRTGLDITNESLRDMRENEFADMTVPELARVALHRQGVSTRGMSRYDVVGYAFRPDAAPSAKRTGLVGHGSSDFANLLENVANKALLQGFEEAPESWQAWTRQTSLPDFRANSRTARSAFSDLDTIPEGGEYKHGTVSDLKESITATKKGKLIAITREAMINDDLSGLSGIPQDMGRAANRSIGDAVYDILINPPTMNQDATGLFRTTPGNNQVATSGGPPTVAALNVARNLMALQTDPSGNAVLNISPQFLIVPVALETTANVLMAAEQDPAEGATTSFRSPNPFRGRFTVVADARLDGDSAAKWYMAANPTVFDTVEVGFVGGRREPFLESRDGWTVDGVEYKVRIEFGVAALDFRGMFYNVGA